MANLFDSSSSIDEGGSIGTRESCDSFIRREVDVTVAQDEPHDVPTLTVATVLSTNKPGHSESNVGTYHYNEKSSIIDAEEERDKLRITSSLMDDDVSTDSDNDDDEVNTSLLSQKKDIFRNTHKEPPTVMSSFNSLASWNTINLLDEASESQAETGVIHKTQSFSDRFNSVYGEVATAAASKNKMSAISNSNDNIKRLQNARTLKDAIKSFGAGLTNATTCDAMATSFPMVASSWDVDVDDFSHLSGKKRTADKRFSIGNYNNNDNNKRRRQMPLDIRSELVLMQDKMDQYELTIQSLQRDNSALSTTKSHLQSMLEQSNKALRSAQLEAKVSKSRADSLTIQVNEMKSELHEAKQDILLVQKEYEETIKIEQNRMTALNNEHKRAFQREQDKHINEIASLKSEISCVEEIVDECKDVIDRQAKKIINLEGTLAKTTTAATDALEVANEAREERDFWKSRAKLTPKSRVLATSFVHTTEYYSCEQQQKLTPTRSTGKENNNVLGCCSICYKEQSGIVRRCKCGKVDCHKWAHAHCLEGKSNVSTSVSHPGTPPPPLPLILCNGVELLIRKK
eukprot:scaffold967_cov148-Skeletonema_menzelii.AAC.22